MSKTIGVLTTHIGGAMRPYEKVFSLAVAKTAEKLGINLVFYSGGFYEMQTGFERLRNFVYDFVKYDKPDGLLVISSLLGNFIELEVMGSFFARFHGIPAVSAGVKIPGIPSIVVDNAAGMETVTRHLTETHGCKAPIILGGPEINTETRLRLDAALGVLGKAGVTLPPDRIFSGNWDKDSGNRVAAYILEHNILFDSVISVNDEMAFGFIEGMEKNGRLCPRDYLLTGFDNIPAAGFFDPPLTTITQSPGKLGENGIIMLDRLIDGHPVPDETFVPTELCVRESCGCGLNPEYVNDVEDANRICRSLHRDYDREERRDAVLTIISEGLMNTTTMEQLSDVLAGSLPRIPEVASCSLLLFHTPGAKDSGLKPAISWNRETGARFVENPENQISTKPPLSTGSPLRIVEALNFGNKTFGLLVFEIDSILFSLTGTLREQISVTLNNIDSFKRIAALNRDMAQKVDRLTALRSIDLAITNRSSMERLMTVLLEQIIAQQQVAAAKITLLDSGTGGETLSVSKGLWVPIPPDHQPPHDQEISLPDTTAAGDSRFAKILGETGIRAYFSRPLMIQKDCVGLVELFNRSPLLKDRDWFTFLDTLTGQIVIAIENITLFKGLQTANNNLRSAYNTTIEGWSRALDMRDHETEGHCIRVARTSVELGKKLGLGEQELEALYRGALLHDIGKVAIPDSILLKPGPLTEEEWQIMRLHPQYAHDLLSPIDFLQPSITVPWRHHESWDGSGYPGRLAGKDIPFFARIFALIDVWDALSSDRPYRNAWTPEKAREYIAARSGIQFDPEITRVFLTMDF